MNRNPSLIVASEDFHFMLEKVPGCYFNIGNGDSDDACEVHNPATISTTRRSPSARACSLKLSRIG